MPEVHGERRMDANYARKWTGFAAFLLGLGMAHAQKNLAPNALTETRSFAPGRQLHLEVNVGDIRILSGSGDPQIRLVIQPRADVSPAEVRSWIQRFEVQANHANIRLHLPKRGNRNGTVTIYVPDPTDLDVDLGVGEVTINGISGDKDVDVKVGELKLVGLNPAEYGIVKNSTDVGDVQDDVFSGRQSGWLGKSENVIASGKHHIRDHVGIGDIRLRKTESAQKN